MSRWLHRLSAIDPIAKKGICSHCGPVDLRYRNKGGGRSRWHCVEKCREQERKRSKSPSYLRYQEKYQKEWRDRNPGKVARYNRRAMLKIHGLTEEDFDRMFQERDGKCDICRQKFEKLFADHDHVTLRLRGLVCLHCNSMLGFAKDRAEVLLAGAKYLNPQ